MKPKTNIVKPKLLPSGIMVIEGDQWLSKWIEQTGRLDHDPTIRERIVPRLKPGDWVVDAGAALGDHTVAYAQAVGPGGKVYAFEPNPLFNRCLWHNAEPYKQISVWHWPLSDDGIRTHRLVESDNVGASHLVPIVDEGHPRDEMSDRVTISVTLDSCNLSRLDFMKIDVEGMEMKVLRGAEQTLKRHHPLLFIELNRGHLSRNQTTPEAIVEYLAGLGYRIEFLEPSHSLAMEQVDVFFCPV